MAMLDEDFGTDSTPADGDDGVWSGPEAEHDWRSRFERERARAEAAEARAEELRWAEVRSRSDARVWQSRFESSRRRLTAAAEETKEVRRRAKEALSLEPEVARLKRLLSEAGKKPQAPKTTPAPASRDAGRLRKALETAQAQKDRIRSLRTEVAGLRKAAREAEARKDRIRSLRMEVAGLRQGIQEAEVRKGEVRALSRLTEHLRARLRDFQDQRDRVRVLSWQVDILRLDLDGVRASLKMAEDEKKALEDELAKVRASRATLSKALFGGRSERQERPRSERPRGHQPGAPGHGRTRRPALQERTEEHNPPPDARVCGGCGKAYVANGAHVSTLVEIHVAAHKRVIRRPRWRRTCECAGSPLEVSAPPAPRLFVDTPYGISFWARFLFERYGCFRPLERVAAWLADQGLPVSSGTLADSVHRFAALFDPVAQAILAHQNGAAVRHGDETGWRVQSLREQGRSSRAWLWTSVSDDAVYFHIDPSRNAAVARTLFGAGAGKVFLVCDRLSTYKKMARELGGKVVLCWCWSHQRRDFIDCAAGQEELARWRQEWIERIAAIYRLNESRLAHYDPGGHRQSEAFIAAQAELKAAVDALFADAERELAALSAAAREAGALRSLVNHRQGLSVFVEHPQVPMDNNVAERVLRGPVIGRGLSFGSDSEGGARFTARMYSVLGTLAANGINVLRWLEAWLGECAANGGRPPRDLSPWLPWSMSGERRRALAAPG